MRVHAGGDDIGKEFFAGLQDDACGTAMLHENFSDWRFGANLDAGFARRIRNRVRNSTGAAAAEAPGTECAVDFAHVVMEENVGGAGRANTEEGADDARGGHGGFEDVRFEPLVEKIRGAHGHKLDERVALVRREFTEAL